MKKLFVILAVALSAALAFSSCTKSDPAAANTMTLRGQTLAVRQALYAPMGNGNMNLDLDLGPNADTNIHGYGQGFPEGWIGKTTQLPEGDFFLSFNPMSGPSIDPVIKSGTITITQVSDMKLHIVINAEETNGQKLLLDCVAYDETKIDWDTFQYK